MRFSRCHLRNTFRCAAIFTAIGLAGCGNSCFVGFSNNGNGGVIIKAGNPAPACSLSQANGTLSVVALESSVCETCADAARVEHVFVTLRSIQLRSSASDDANPPDWLELAPRLAKEPRQIDLMGDAMPVILVESALVPAGSYREVRLQFLAASPTSAEEFPAENACGETRWNCIVMAGGHVEPLHLPGEVPELHIPSQSIESDSVVVLPDSRMDLRLSLVPRQGYYFSSTEGLNCKTRSWDASRSCGNGILRKHLIEVAPREVSGWRARMFFDDGARVLVLAQTSEFRMPEMT